MALEKFPAPLMRSKTGMSREDDFYLGIEDKNEFFNYYRRCTDRCMNPRCTNGCMSGQDEKTDRCTDKQIKFFNSVMDGKLSVVKHSLNIGSIRNDDPTMRAAILLACRFGQPQVLDCLMKKINVDFFLVENLNFVVTIVAGCSEARRFEIDQEPSGILDVLIKYDRESIDSVHLKQTRAKRRGKFEFTCVLQGKKNLYGNQDYTTPFMELCGTKSKCMAGVIRKILDSGLVDINQSLGCDRGRGCALAHVIQTGEPKVLKMVLDEMIWESSNPLGKENQQELHIELVMCMYQLSKPITTWHGHARSMCSGCNYEFPFPLREGRMDVLQHLMDKCLRVNHENKIGYEIMRNIKKLDNDFHDHVGAMMLNVIEEERRIAHANGKITLYDLEIVEEPKVTPKYNSFYDLEILEGAKRKPKYNFHGDQFERYLRSINEGSIFVDDELFEEVLEEYRNRKCWSCGDRDSELLKCKQCRKARYCDALCQDEGWNKHQLWCHQQKVLLLKEGQGKTREEKKLSKAKLKSAARAFKELWLKVECGDC